MRTVEEAVHHPFGQAIRRWRLVGALTIAVGMSLPRLVLAQAIVFPAPFSEPLVEVPAAMGVGDLNGDGRPDVVVTNFLAATVTIYLAGDDPIFNFVGDFPSGGPGHRVLIQEATGDFMADVLVSEQESDNVWLLRGAGDGTVGEPELIKPGHDPVGLAVRDINDDGTVDLLVALSDEFGGRLAVMLGRGDGAYELIQTILLPRGSEEVVVADFDGDEILDAAVANSGDASVSILRGQGEGMFAAEPVNLTVGEGPSPLALADVNEDGFADLVVGITGDDTVAILRGSATGAFAAPESLPTGGQALKAMVVADINDDRHSDIIVASLRSQSVSVLIGRGDGSFEPARGFVTHPLPIAVAAFDVDGDTVLDVLTANEGPGSSEPALVLLRGVGDGELDAVNQFLTPAGGSGVAIADFDEDAYADAVASFLDDEMISLFRGGPGRVSTAQSFPVGARPAAVLTADVNVDGHADVMTLDSIAQISVLLGTGTGEFATAVHQPLPSRGRAFAAKDIDGDLDPDLFVVDVAGNLRALLNDGMGAFSALEPVVLPGQASEVITADFNHDGQIDVAVNFVTSPQILVFLGNEEHAFGEPIVVTTNGIAFSLASGDVDGNGSVDMFFSSPSSRGAAPVINDGEAMFTLGTRRFAGTFPTNVTLRDLDNDGFPEAIVNDQLADRITVLINDGTGVFDPDPQVFASIAPAGVGTADFDGDGRYDAFVAGRTVTRLRNSTDVAHPVLRGDGNGDQRLTVADFTALILELQDHDGISADDTSRGDFAGNPGADADGDGGVTSTDLRALWQRFWHAASAS